MIAIPRLPLEFLLAALLTAIFLILSGERRRIKPRHIGYDFILIGFGLVSFGSWLDWIDPVMHFHLEDEAVGSFLIFGEMVIGYLAGVVFVGTGLMMWIPALARYQAQSNARLRAEEALRRSKKTLESRNASLKVVNALVENIQRSPDAKAIAQQTVSMLMGYRYTSFVSFYVLESDSQNLRLLAEDGIAPDKNPTAGGLIPVHQSLAGLCILRRSLVVLRDIKSDKNIDPQIREVITSRGVRSAVLVPLLFQGKALGCISLLHNKPHRFPRFELDTYRAIGRSVSLALINVRNFAALHYQASHDGLTNLANRNVLRQDLRELIIRERSTASLLLLDLDRFKDINDTLGHRFGDHLLKKIGPRLSESLGAPKASVYRLGGDEFAILVPAIHDPDQARQLAANLLEKIRQPYDIEGMKLEIGGSIGIALYQGEGPNSHELLRQADVAMYQAKRNTLGVCIYSPSIDHYTPERLALASEVAGAVRNGQLTLHYQPKVDLKTDKIGSVEALLRWQHPDMGLLHAAEFIPIAEVSNAIQGLTQWVLSEAVAQLATWKQAGVDLSIAINLSARNLMDRSFVAQLEQLIETHDIDPTRLELELTETALMNDPKDAFDVLRQFADLGVKLAIDDFGTGFSSFSSLRRFQLHTLKIDYSFVRDLTQDSQSEAIVRSIIGLAKTLGVGVVAEGVENEAALEALRSMDCDEAQGNYLSPALAANDLETFLQNYRIVDVRD